jgi:hypothetical protein
MLAPPEPRLVYETTVCCYLYSNIFFGILIMHFVVQSVLDVMFSEALKDAVLHFILWPCVHIHGVMCYTWL